MELPTRRNSSLRRNQQAEVVVVVHQHHQLDHQHQHQHRHRSRFGKLGVKGGGWEVIEVLFEDPGGGIVCRIDRQGYLFGQQRGNHDYDYD